MSNLLVASWSVRKEYEDEQLGDDGARSEVYCGLDVGVGNFRTDYSVQYGANAGEHEPPIADDHKSHRTFLEKIPRHVT